MQTAARLTALVLVLSACGTGEAPADPARSARAAQAPGLFPRGPELAQAKRTIVAACRAKGASPERTALVVAIACGETEDLQAHQRDATKDGSGDAANLSAFNVNKAFLKQVGWQEGQGPDLNDQANLGAATDWVLKGIDKLGEDGFMNFHRGGSTGFADGCSYGCREYRDCIQAVQRAILADPSLLEDNRRVALAIPHV